MDAYGWTWEQMGEYLDKFCRMYESGEELPDYMYIKRIELMVDEALTKGYKDTFTKTQKMGSLTLKQFFMLVRIITSVA